VLTDEPGLKLVWAEDVADDQVVGAPIACLVGRLRDIEATMDDDLVGLEESGDLDRNPFPAARRTRDAGHLGMSPLMAMVPTISTCSSKCLSKSR
jgi:hypothetical protein